METRALPVMPKIVWQTGSNLFMDVARLCMSLLHAWTLDGDLDTICVKKLRLMKPSLPLCFGIMSRQGQLNFMNGKAPKKKSNVHVLSFICL